MTKVFSKKQLFLKLFLSTLFLVSLIVFYEAWQNLTTLISFSAAYIFGTLFLFADEQFLYKFYVEKIGDKPKNDSHNSELISRNFLFVLALPFLSIFVLTSSGSIFGTALILSLNFYLLIEMWQLREEYLLFKDRFFSMSSIKINAKLANRICLLASVYFVLLLSILLF